MRVGAMRGPVEFFVLGEQSIFSPYRSATRHNRPYRFPSARSICFPGALDDGDVHRGIREFLRTSDLSRDAEEDGRWRFAATIRVNPR